MRPMNAGLLALLLLPALLLGPVSGARAEDAPPAEAGDAAAPRAPTAADQAPLRWRSIGPANMGGRITAIAVVESRPTTWWAATASGGLLKTVDNGITFEHQFDREDVVSIGDVAVAPSNPDVVWVGTGECNPRNSVSWGRGVYKSVDGGKTWKHMGLARTFQIGAVRVHPTDPDIVYVGALGRLWGPNPERGLYKTTDGGGTWTRVHHVDDRTGVIDVQLDPSDPETLLVATYERQRDMFDVNDPAKKVGPGSGLWRSTDGGATFTRITAGLPSCAIGRIGLDWWAGDPRHVYMVLESEKTGAEPENAAWLGVNGKDAEVGARLTDVTKDGPAAKADLRKDDIVVAVDGKTVHGWKELVRALRMRVAGDRITVEIARARQGMEIEIELARRPPSKPAPPNRMGVTPPRSPFGAFLGGQQPNLQAEQGAEGHEFGGIYHSEDGGLTWTRINSLNPRPMYFSEIRVDPSDRTRIWVLGIRLWRSEDGGKTFEPDGHPRGVHVDHHALWIDPANSDHLILGNDGGVYVSYDGGAHYDHLNHVAIGQFYDVGIGPRRDYRVYGGLQDNGSWGGPARVAHGPGPRNEDWIRIGGGDGFRVRVDPEDPNQVYFEAQNGNVARRHLLDGSRGSLRPKDPKGVRYRFNWYTPFVLSSHNSRIVYVAGNHVFRSLDRGTKMKSISPDITATERGSATALAESPLDAAELYVGTDDGALWRTRDGGHTWTDLHALSAPEGGSEAPAAPAAAADAEADRDGAADAAEPEAGPAPGPDATPPGEPLARAQPARRHVAWLEASRHVAGRVYAVWDAHRSDDDRPLVFVSEDHGATWRDLAAGLPAGAGTTRVLREDRTRPDILYLGTEFGAFVTIDRGRSWAPLGRDLPTVAVHQFAQHATTGDLVAGTHGRSLWVLDTTTLRQMTPAVLAEDVHLYRPAPAVQWRPAPQRGQARGFTGTNPPTGARIHYRLAAKLPKLELRIAALDGRVLQTLPAKAEAGTHEVVWNLRAKAPPRRRVGPRVGAGRYRVTLVATDAEGAERTWSQDLLVEDDPTQPDTVWMAFEDAAEEAAAAKAEAKAKRHLPQHLGRDE